MSLVFQTVAEAPLCAVCWYVVDDVSVDVWELIFYWCFFFSIIFRNC